MKLTRILALVLMSVMLVLAAVSCGELPPEITVKLQIQDPDNEGSYILDVDVVLQEHNPTVLSAFQAACIENEIKYDLNSESTAVLNIADHNDLSAEASGDGLVYYWMYLLNDLEPTSGQASTNPVADGDKITYIYDSFNPEDLKK